MSKQDGSFITAKAEDFSFDMQPFSFFNGEPVPVTQESEWTHYSVIRKTKRLLRYINGKPDKATKKYLRHKKRYDKMMERQKR